MTLNRSFIRIAAPAAFIFLSATAYAGPLEEFYKNFKSGRYPEALIELNKSSIKDDSPISKAYLSGITYSKMQEYDKAVIQFEKAIKEKNESADLYYEYGQALYAANELKKSREAFKISASKKFNTPASLYYIAHTSQILEEYDVARENYTKVLKEKSVDPKMKQVAQFQLAETLMAIARDKSRERDDIIRRVSKFILPMLNTAYNIDKTSPIAADIKQRTSELMLEFGLDPNVLVNGRRMLEKRYGAYVSQKIRYDDNITLTSEENNTTQSKEKSAIFETEAYGTYDFVLKKRYIISPEARFIYTEHTNRQASVIQNNSLVMNFSLKNKYEHKVNEQPASLLFDIDYTKTLKEQTEHGKKKSYASAVNFTLGESFSYFEAGDTTVRIKRKSYTGANEAISNHTTTLNADQIVFLPIQHLLVALFEMNFNNNYNNKVTNTNTYLLRFDYIIPQIMPTYTLSFALGTTLTDTKQQKASRGTELSLNPSVDFSKELNAVSKIGLNYDFTKSNSDSADYSYSKHVITTEFRYNF